MDGKESPENQLKKTRLEEAAFHTLHIQQEGTDTDSRAASLAVCDAVQARENRCVCLS